MSWFTNQLGQLLAVFGVRYVVLVDHLAPARIGPVMQRHGDPHDGVHGRQAVADGDARPRRRPATASCCSR